MIDQDHAALPGGTPGAAFNLEARTVPAANGLEWWTKAWPLFTAQIGMWIGLIVVTFVVFFLASLVPLLGQLATMLLWPVVVGGLMLGAREVDRNGELSFDHLSAGFAAHTGQLVLVGVAFLVGMIVVAGVVMLVAGVGMGTMMGAGGGGDAATMGAAGVASLMLAFLVAAVLFLPVYMATWFAPALIVFHGANAVDALKASFTGCLKNVLAFLIYGVIGILLSVVASIPLGLGWLVLGPVAVVSVYVGYRDIYLGPSA